MNRLATHLFAIGSALVTVCPHARAAALPFGQTQAGTIGSAAQSNSYTFSATANDVVNFTIVATSGQLSPRILVYSPDGTQLSFAYSNSPGLCRGAAAVELNGVKLPVTGTYTALINDCGDTNTGNYAIFAQRTNNPAGANALSFGGQPQAGVISSAAQTNSYTFSGNANDVVNFTTVATSDQLSPRILVYNPDGTRLSFAYSNSPGLCRGAAAVELNGVKLPATGNYTVLVADCGDTNTGNYAIFAQRTNNPAGAAALSFGGQPQTGAIGSAAQSNSYTFGANANSLVNFTTVATSGPLSPRILVYNPDGTLLSFAYSNSPGLCRGAPTVELNGVKLPATGTYTVLIGDCGDTNTGNYNISAQCFGVCAAPPPPPNNCTYSLAPPSQLFPSAGGAGSIGVLTLTGCPWTASAVTSFLTITSGFSGSGPGTVQYSVSANSSAAIRSGTMTIAGQTATVTQSGTSPFLLVSPSSLTVSYVQGNPPPPDTTISINTNSPALNYSVSIQAGAPWLSVFPLAGTGPGSLSLKINPAGMAPGTYQGTVNVNASAASPSTQSITVALTITGPGPAKLSVETSALNFSFATGSQSRTERRNISNAGGGTLAFQVSTVTSSGGQWLQATPGTGQATPLAPASLTVTADPTGLSPGTYTGTVSVTAGSDRQDVPVTITINSVQQTILLSQTGLTFTAVAAGGAVPPQTFGVLNIGQGVMDWAVSATTLTGGSNWLAVSPASGSTDASSLTVPLVTVNVNPAGLSAGDYYGQVRVDSKAASNTPQFVSIVLTVLPQGSDPGPVVLPTGLIFAGVSGGAQPAPQTVQVSNVTGGNRVFISGKLTTDGANWFSNQPTGATVGSGQTTSITVTANSTGLTPGVRRGALTLLFQDGAIRNVNILFLVLRGAGSNVSEVPSSQATSPGCTPTTYFPLISSLGSNFVVPAAWPNTIESRVVDDCGNLMTDGSVVITFSNGDPPLPLVSLKDGRWSGTWQVRNTSASLVTVTVTAQNAAQNIRGSAQVTGGLRASVDAPTVGLGGVVNLANYGPTPLAPGDIVGIFGTRLSQGKDAASQLPLDIVLAGTKVVLGGILMPLFYASEGQVNAVVPFGLTPNTQQQLIVQRGNTYSVPEPVTVAAALPAIYSKDGSGKGQGTIIDVNGKFVEPGNPAGQGDIIVIYCNGLGEVDQQVAAGVAAPLSPLARVTGPLSLTIGGVSTSVQFAGLVPGLTALYQVNATVPAGVPPGNQVPVVLTVSGQSSVPVTIAVK